MQISQGIGSHLGSIYIHEYATKMLPENDKHLPVLFPKLGTQIKFNKSAVEVDFKNCTQVVTSLPSVQCMMGLKAIENLRYAGIIM